MSDKPDINKGPGLTLADRGILATAEAELNKRGAFRFRIADIRKFIEIATRLGKEVDEREQEIQAARVALGIDKTSVTLARAIMDLNAMNERLGARDAVDNEILAEYRRKYLGDNADEVGDPVFGELATQRDDCGSTPDPVAEADEVEARIQAQLDEERDNYKYARDE